jgi:hypothetical protein
MTRALRTTILALTACALLALGASEAHATPAC